ncbi:hypothetical protein Tco_0472301 [Tanacetum coccineum]
MVYQLTKFHVQRVDMVINPPWNLPFLGAKGLTSPEQTATGKGISNPLMAVMVCQKPYGIQLTNVSSTETLKNSCCKDTRRRLEVLQIKNNLKNSIYNILRKLKVFKVKIKNVLKELEVHKSVSIELILANSNSYLRDILGDILGKDMYYPLTFVKPIRVSLVYKRNPKAQASVSAIPLSTYLNLGQGELAHTRLHNMPKDIKVPLILRRPFLSTAHAKIDVYKRKITLRVGEEKIIFTSVKSASSLIKRVYMLSLRERMKLDLEARLMGETLVLNRSLDPFLEDYIELNDLNEPFELRRNQGDDLMPTIDFGGYGCLSYRDEGIGRLFIVGERASHPSLKTGTNEQADKIPSLLKVSEKDKKNGISALQSKSLEGLTNEN